MTDIVKQLPCFTPALCLGYILVLAATALDLLTLRAEEELKATVAGEKRNGYSPWEKDLYGTGPVLASKRKARGWDEKRIDELAQGQDEIVLKLLRWDSRCETFPHTLPWETDTAK